MAGHVVLRVHAGAAVLSALVPRHALPAARLAGIVERRGATSRALRVRLSLATDREPLDAVPDTRVCDLTHAVLSVEAHVGSCDVMVDQREPRGPSSTAIR